MKLVYIAIENDIRTTSGVIKKIYGQLKAMRLCGIEAKGCIFFADYEKANISFEKEGLTYIPICVSSKYPTIFGKVIYRRNLYKSIIDIITQSSDTNIIYFRYPYSDWNLLKLVKRFPKKILFEHQTKECKELWLRRGLSIEYLLEKYFAPKVFRYCAGGVGVTDEISEYEKDRSFKRSYKTVAISNGFNMDNIKIRKNPSYDGHMLKILFVANINRWHALDRLIIGLANYNGKTEICIYVAGEGPELSNLQSMVVKYSLGTKVKFLGGVSGEELDRLYDTCHIAIGSLGIHRKGLNEAATLKVREYIARGIPFVLSETDTDISKNAEFNTYFQKVEEDDSPIDICSILEFASKVLADDDHPKKMRELAIKYIDMKVKTSKLKTFINQIIKN